MGGKIKKFIILTLIALFLIGCGARVSGHSGPNAGGRAEVPVLKW